MSSLQETMSCLRILSCEVPQEQFSVRLIFWWAGAKKQHWWHVNARALEDEH